MLFTSTLLIRALSTPDAVAPEFLQALAASAVYAFDTLASPEEDEATAHLHPASVPLFELVDVIQQNPDGLIVAYHEGILFLWVADEQKLMLDIETIKNRVNQSASGGDF